MPIFRTGLMAIGLLASGAAYAGAPGWSLSETSGQVSVVSTGVVKVAMRGGALAVGDIVNTGRNGRAVLVRGEEYLVVAPNSRIRVADPVKTGGLTQIIENFGNVVYKIKKMTMPHFAVETPFLAAVVKGTTFSVTVTEKGASVQVIEGRVEVATRDGGASFMVLPGDIGSVSATAPGRLDVQGRETRSISSATPAAATAAVAASIADSAGNSDSAFEGTIVTAVSEGPVRLDALSDGMVRGDSSLVAMISTTTQTGRAVVTPSTAPVTGTGTVIDAAPGAITPPDVVQAPLPPVPAEGASATAPGPQSLPPAVGGVVPPVEEVVAALPPVMLPPVAGIETPPVNEAIAALPPQSPLPPSAPAGAITAPALPPVAVAVAALPAVLPSNSGNGNGNGNAAFGNAGGTGHGTNGNGNAFGNNGNGNSGPGGSNRHRN